MPVRKSNDTFGDGEVVTHYNPHVPQDFNDQLAIDIQDCYNYIDLKGGGDRTAIILVSLLTAHTAKMCERMGPEPHDIQQTIEQMKEYMEAIVYKAVKIISNQITELVLLKNDLNQKKDLA